jgi:hypothetical protein
MGALRSSTSTGIGKCCEGISGVFTRVRLPRLDRPSLLSSFLPACSILSLFVLIGTFGQQAQEITIYETVVRTLKSHVGGTGPYLNAGFPEDDEPPDPYTPYHSREAEDEEEPEDSRYTKEIILSGSGKSMWGNFRIIGRVRAWDGLVVISKEYIVSR